MTDYRSIFRLLSLLALGAWLAACDSSVGTSDNPNLGNLTTGYNGPPARTADILSFETNFWVFLTEENRCGQCHRSDQAPYFVDYSDVNAAYSEAIPYADLQDPASSLFVSKVGGGHNCWLASNADCATIIERMIDNWASDSNVTSSRAINLTAPTIKAPGDAKSFPPSATTAGTNGTSFADTVHPILIGTAAGITTNNCQGCHEETANPLPIAPFFGNDDVDSAFEAAKAKMDIDTPANSRFVVRLGSEFHNCWSDCPSDAQRMLDAIQLWSDGIQPTPVDPNLVTSMALNMDDGIVAAGGNRHESNLVALWEFKTGSGLTAYDTSGIDPAVDLTLIGSVSFMPSYGLDFSGGRAQANTIASDKLHTFIEGTTREYAIEAWITPANVSQEDANIISYSGGDAARNFTLAQDMYDYEFYNRTTDSDANGEPLLSSDDGNDNEILQASLQHVVVNYNPITGREIYVNGQLVPGTTEPTPGPNSVQNVWDDTFAFILGNEVSGNRPWSGQIRMAAVHNRTLTPAQILQNFDVGVGEKYYLLFYIGHRIGINDAYIMFEVSQFDSYSYLFDKPTFINLDPDWTPGGFNIQGMRIGINGKEALAGQVYASMNVNIDGSYDPATGQLLSPLGTIIALEKGRATDEFFLTFEVIGGQSNAFNDPQPPAPADPADPPQPVSSDIGMRTFEEIHMTISEITGVPIGDTGNAAVQAVYDDYLQQLPAVEAIDAFLPSHQMAVAQLALTSCSELVEDAGARAAYFPGFDFGAGSLTAFDNATKRAQVIDPILTAVMNVDQVTPANNLTTQPLETTIHDMWGSTAQQHLDDPAAASGDEYDSLITELLASPSNTDTAARTRQIVKAVCAAVTGGAVMIVQ